jgi:hypothetical protein
VRDGAKLAIWLQKKEIKYNIMITHLTFERKSNILHASKLDN